MNKFSLVILLFCGISLAGWSQSYQAHFQGTDIKTTGEANLETMDGKKIVALSTSFETQEGPDLHVYLAADTAAADFTDLGPLESFTGKQTYEIPAETNVDRQPMLLIYCKKYSHLFGYADLTSDSESARK